MSLPVFLKMLLEHGRIRVPHCTPIEQAELRAARDPLVEFEAVYRQGLAWQPPAFDPEVAVWGAAVLYRICQCLVYREINVSQAVPEQMTPQVGPRTAAVHYSGDLVLRFLPDAWRLARALAPEDPLVLYLQRLAVVWPLSSIGISGLTGISVSEICQDRALLTLYLDRVVERNDLERLGDPLVADAMRAALGMFPELAPQVAARLKLPPQRSGDPAAVGAMESSAGI
jgi:MoxR-vWA-beta-propeller ternary system domain bpX4